MRQDRINRSKRRRIPRPEAAPLLVSPGPADTCHVDELLARIAALLEVS